MADDKGGENPKKVYDNNAKEERPIVGPPPPQNSRGHPTPTGPRGHGEPTDVATASAAAKSNDPHDEQQQYRRYRGTRAGWRVRQNKEMIFIARMLRRVAHEMFHRPYGRGNGRGRSQGAHRGHGRE